MKFPKQPGFTCWAEELAARAEELADDPREQHEAEDRLHDFTPARSRELGVDRGAAAWETTEPAAPHNSQGA